MKLLILITALLFSIPIATAQNFPACDSLTIDCCTYNILGPNSVTISVTNNSSVLFDYPSFVLYDSNLDTVAIETVNYFGIGTSPQPHTMNIVAPLNLPFSGFLNLYTLFGDTLACSFPIFIPDTITGIEEANVNILTFFPNPIADDNILRFHNIEHKGKMMHITITTMQGATVLNKSFGSDEKKITIENLLPGIYIVKVEIEGIYYTGRFLKLNVSD